MVVAIRDKFYLEYFELDKEYVISHKFGDDQVLVAKILWDPVDNDGYIRTIKDNFQTCVVTYKAFGDFICLVDEAFDRLRMSYYVENK